MKIKQVIQTLVVSSASVALAKVKEDRRVLADFTNGDPFLSYLAPLKFGENPGPCPNEQNKCRSTFSEVPQSIKDIEVFFGLSIGNLISDGDFAIWELTCSNIEMDSITLTVPNNPFVEQGNVKRELKIGLDADDIALNCRMRAEALNLRTTLGTFNVGNVVINFIKNDMTGDGDGLQLATEMRWFSPDFDKSFPNSMDFLDFNGNDDNACNLDISQGFDIDIGNSGLVDFLVDALISIFKGIIQGIACNVITQLAFIGDRGDNNPGLINLELAKLFANVERYEAEGLNDDSDFLTIERNLVRDLDSRNLIELEKDVNFRTDAFFEGISLALNDILGGPSSNPAYDLLINEVMDLLLGDTSGTFAAADVADLFNLETYPSFEFLTAATGIGLTLKGFELRGLNQFRNLKIIDNDFENGENDFEYTAKTAVSMDELGASLNLDMVFIPGEWVTSPANPVSSVPINFNMDLSMSDLNVAIANFVLVQPELIEGIQVGQLLGPSQSLENILDCSAQIFDYLSFSGMALNYGALDDIAFSGASALGDLIQEGADVFNAISSGGMAEQLPFILENFVRLQLNEVFDQYFVDATNGLKQCPSYVSATYNPESFQIADSISVGLFSNIIQNVIGGDPVGTSDASVNSLINTALTYYLIDRTDPIFGGVISSTAPGTYVLDEKIDVAVTFNDGLQGPGSFDQLSLGINGPTLENVDSVGQMLVNQVTLQNGEKDPYSAEVILQYGHYSGAGSPAPDISPLKLSMPFKVLSVLQGETRADEDFEFVLDLALDIQFLVSAEIDKDKTFLSTVGMFVNHLACSFAVLNAKELRELLMGVNTVGYSLTPNTPFSTETDFGIALADLKTDMENNPDFIAHLINYLLDRLETETIDLFNTDFQPPFDIETCTTVESPLAGTAFGSGLPTISIGAINDFLNEATTTQVSPRNKPPSFFEQEIIDRIRDENGPNAQIYDITNEANGYLSIISETLTAETMKGTVIALANSTSDPENPSVFDFLTDGLILEPQTQAEIDAGEELSVSFIMDIGEVLGLNYDPTAASFIEDLKVFFHPLKLKNVQNFRKLDILKPYTSDGERALFTTTNDFSYGGGDLELELQIDIEMNSDVIDVDNNLEGIVTETIKINILMEEVDVELMVSLAVDEEKLRNTFMGDLLLFNVETQLMDVRNEGIECVLPNLLFDGGVNFPQIQFNFAGDKPASELFTFTVETVGDVLAQSLVDVIDSFSEIIIETLMNQLPNVSQGPVRRILNEALRESLAGAHERECKDYQEDLPDTSSLPLGDIFNFRDSPLDTIINVDMIGGELLNPGSPLNLNRILRSTSVVLEGVGVLDVLPSDLNIIYNGFDLGFGNVVVGEFQLPEMGTPEGGIIAELELLDNRPFSRDEPTMTRNHIRFTGPAKSAMRLGYTFDKIFKPVEGSGASRSSRLLQDEFMETIAPDAVYNDLLIELSMHDLEITFDIDVKMDVQAFMNLNAGNLLSLYATPNEVNCLLSIFDYGGLVPHSFDVKFSTVSFEFDCATECNSPLLNLLEITAVGTSAEINAFLTDMAEGLLVLIELFLSNGDPTNGNSAESTVTAFLNNTIAQAKDQCVGIDVSLPEIPGEDPHIYAALYMLFFGVAILGGVALYFIVASRKHYRLKAARLEAVKDKSKQEVAYEKASMTPMAWHPALTTRARILIATFFFFSFTLVVISNFFTKGATAVIRADVFGSETIDIPLMDFTLESSIDDAWNSGAYPLALVIVISSGYWQYTKLFTLVMCFFIPPTLMSTHRRERVLVILDSLGKWSLIDAYVLILLQVAFRMSVTTESLSLFSLENTTLKEEFGQLFSLDVVVVPKFGGVGFPLAVGFSLITNHMLVYFTRKCEKYDEELRNKVLGYESTEKLNTGKKAISMYRFFVTKEAKSDDAASVFSIESAKGIIQRKFIYQIRPEFRGFVVALTGLTSFLLVIGFFLDAITFEFSGIGGLALSFIDPTLTSNSLAPIDFIGVIPDGQPETTGQTMTDVILQLLYIAFVMVTPVMLIILLVTLFFRKLSLDAQNTLHFIAEIMGAWEAVMVMVVGLLAACFQITLLADFIVTSATGNLCDFLRDQLVGFGVSETDATCFAVTASIPPSGYAFCLAAILLVVLRIMLSSLHDVVIENRTSHAKFVKADRAGKYEQVLDIATKTESPEHVKGLFKGNTLRWAVLKTKRNVKQEAVINAPPDVPTETANPRFSKNSKTSSDEKIAVSVVPDDESALFDNIMKKSVAPTIKPQAAAVPPPSTVVNKASEPVDEDSDEDFSV